jgi:predicted DNA binding CopG/RHH family protein
MPNSNWGGKRPGAGKPKKFNEGTVITLKLSKTLLDKIDGKAKEAGLSRSEWIRQTLEQV